MKKRTLTITLIGLCLLTVANELHARSEPTDSTINSSSICELHSIEMERQLAPIIYGMPHLSEFEETQARTNLFPNGRAYLLGGCIVREKKDTWLYACQKCKEARFEWLKTRGFDDINKVED